MDNQQGPTTQNRELCSKLYGSLHGREVWGECMCAQSCPTLCDLMDYSPPGSSVHGISQAGILEWVAISFSRDRTQVSSTAGKFFTIWATRGLWGRLDTHISTESLHCSPEPITTLFKKKKARVMKDKADWGNVPDYETKETWQLNVKCNPGLGSNSTDLPPNCYDIFCGENWQHLRITW